jgi:hypothetical protein
MTVGLHDILTFPSDLDREGSVNCVASFHTFGVEEDLNPLVDLVYLCLLVEKVLDKVRMVAQEGENRVDHFAEILCCFYVPLGSLLSGVDNYALLAFVQGGESVLRAVA